ncbi:hypothetical protein D3C81_1895590 [compost metagenome]
MLSATITCTRPHAEVPAKWTQNRANEIKVTASAGDDDCTTSRVPKADRINPTTIAVLRVLARS